METIAGQWFLETAEDAPARMNDDRIYSPSNISATPEDTHYQENNATSKGYKSKQIHEIL